MRNRWTRSTYRKRGKIKISPRGAGPRDQTLFSFYPSPPTLSHLHPSLSLSLSPLSCSSTVPLLPQEPHHSLFFTNAPCCQPDWPLCAGFANKFRLRFSSDTRRILTQRIVATLINDVEMNRVPALSGNAVLRLPRSLSCSLATAHGRKKTQDRGYGTKKGRKTPAPANDRGNDRFAPKFEASEWYRSVDRTRQAL